MQPLSKWTDDDIEMWQHDGTYLGFTMAEYVAEIRRREREATKARCCDAIRKRREDVDENIDSGPMNASWRNSEGRVLEGLDAAIDIIRGLQ